MSIDAALTNQGFQQCVGEDRRRGNIKLIIEGQRPTVLFAATKKVGKREGGTLNQVRPYLCIPLIVNNTASHRWYVVPALEILRLAAQKIRGQHTESPFECCTLSFQDLIEFECPAEALAEQITRVSEGLDNRPEIRAVMADHVLNVREVVNNTRTMLNQVLQQ